MVPCLRFLSQGDHFLVARRLGSGGVSLLEAGETTLDGEAAWMGLWRATLQRWWCLLLAMLVARGGLAGDSSVTVASVGVAPCSRCRGLALAMVGPPLRVGLATLVPRVARVRVWSQ